MSYGAFANQSRAYREMEIQSATRGQLVVLLFDYLLSHLARASYLHGSPDLAARSDALDAARTALTELLVALDREKGGDLATHLAAIYSFLLGELSLIGVRPDAAKLERVMRILQQLREAFAHAVQVAPQSAAVA